MARLALLLVRLVFLGWLHLVHFTRPVVSQQTGSRLAFRGRLHQTLWGSSCMWLTGSWQAPCRVMGQEGRVVARSSSIKGVHRSSSKSRRYGGDCWWCDWAFYAEPHVTAVCQLVERFGFARDTGIPAYWLRSQDLANLGRIIDDQWVVSAVAGDFKTCDYRGQVASGGYREWRWDHIQLGARWWHHQRSTIVFWWRYLQSWF